MTDILPEDELSDLWVALELTLNQQLPRDSLEECFRILNARISEVQGPAAQESEFDQYGLELGMLQRMRTQLIALLRIRKPEFSVQ